MHLCDNKNVAAARQFLWRAILFVFYNIFTGSPLNSVGICKFLCSIGASMSKMFSSNTAAWFFF